MQAPPPVEPKAAGSAEPPLTGWARIEALATPVGGSGPSSDLDRAVEIASANADGWLELKYKYPPVPLAEYPRGGEAVAALMAWAKAAGGLPAMPPPMQLGATALVMNNLGEVAIASASDEPPIAAAWYLATQLIRQGHNLMEAEMGSGLLRRARQKREQLGLPIEPVGRPDGDVVRLLAAEALFTRASLAFATSPQGRAQVTQKMKEMPADKRATLTQTLGKDPSAMIPNSEEAVALQQFWLAALDGAQRGEPAATTIARLRRAAEAAPPRAKDVAAMIAPLVKCWLKQLEDPDQL